MDHRIDPRCERWRIVMSGAAIALAVFAAGFAGGSFHARAQA